MHANEVLGPLDSLGQPGDRQRRGVGGQEGVGGEDRLDAAEGLVLERLVLEDRLDDKICTLGEVEGIARCDASEHLVTCRLGHLAARDRLVQDSLRVGLALLSGLHRRVHEDNLDAVAGTDVGDAGAHHPGAHDEALGRLVLRVALGACAALGDVLQVKEERLRHVLGDLASGQACEVARLDLLRCSEVDLRALDGGRHDRQRCGHGGALDLLAQIGREGRQHHRELWVGRCAPGHLVAGCIPGLHGVGMGQHPCLCRGEHLLGRRDDLVDKADVLGSTRLAPLALQEHLHERLLQTEHARGAHDATGAGQHAEGDLGQADLAALGVECDAVVAGQRDLEAAAECGAVDRRGDGLAHGLEAAEGRLDARDLLLEALRVGGGRLDDHVEIGTGEEGLLRARHDDASDVVLLRLEAIKRGLERGDEGVVEGVGTAARVVHGQGDDVVGVLLPAEHVVAHDSPQTRSMMVAMPMPPPMHSVTRP